MKTSSKTTKTIKKVETRGRKKKEIISKALTDGALRDLPSKRLKRLVIKYLPVSEAALFNKISGINRDTTGAHTTTMVNNLNKMGLSIRPVVVARINFLDGKKVLNYIIDGQHLFDAHVRLDEAIPYVEIDINSLEELVETIAMVNSCSKRWTLKDYILAWKCVYSDYKFLEQLPEKYDFEITAMAGAVMSTEPRTMIGIIKGGKFRATPAGKKEAFRIFKNMEDVFKILPNMGRWANSTFVDALIHINRLPEYSHIKLIKYVRENKDKLSLLVQNRESIKEFLAISLK